MSALGLHARNIEVMDQRGLLVERFLALGHQYPVSGSFASRSRTGWTQLDAGELPDPGNNLGAGDVPPSHGLCRRRTARLEPSAVSSAFRSTVRGSVGGRGLGVGCAWVTSRGWRLARCAWLSSCIP